MASGDDERQADEQTVPAASKDDKTSTGGAPGWPPSQPQPTWPPQPQPAPPNWQALTPLPPAPYSPSRLPLVLSILAAVLIAFSAGMVVDHMATPAAEQQAPLQGFDVYLQALTDVRQHFVGRSALTDKQLLYGSIKGLVDSLGDTNHSTFLTPQQYADMTSELSGSVVGIGVLISDTNGVFTVTRVIRDSPADQAGMKPGDQITAVDGTTVVGLDFDGLAAKVRGDVGTTVTITVVHAGSTTPVDLTMARAEVSAPLVDWNMVPGTTIADIALYEFSDGASAQVGDAIAGAARMGATGIILDLRGNPGGYAGEATQVLGLFLSGGVAYMEEDADGTRTKVNVDSNGHPTSLPLAVIVDESTASAAEVTAGCLQDTGRGTIVGMNTVGTGTILLPFPLSDGSVILLGVSDWLTPNGNRIFGKGITPDTLVSMAPGAVPLDPYDFETMTNAQIQSSGDAQLLKAVDLLGK